MGAEQKRAATNRGGWEKKKREASQRKPEGVSGAGSKGIYAAALRARDCGKAAEGTLNPVDIRPEPTGEKERDELREDSMALKKWRRYYKINVNRGNHKGSFGFTFSWLLSREKSYKQKCRYSVRIWTALRDPGYIQGTAK